MNKLKKLFNTIILIIMFISSFLFIGHMAFKPSPSVLAMITQDEAELCVILSTDIKTKMIDIFELGDCLDKVDSN